MSIVRHAGNLREPTVNSPEAMYKAIKEAGIIPFFENSIPGYSIEELTPPSCWFDGEDDPLGPWDWKIDCVQSGDIAYGKFLGGGKASFATIGWYRELRNYRLSLPKHVPDAAGERVMEYVAEHGSVTIREIRGLLGIKKSAADALVTRLQMGCRLVTGDIRRVYRGEDLHYNGWQVASFCRPEDLFEVDFPFAFPGMMSPGGGAPSDGQLPPSQDSQVKAPLPDTHFFPTLKTFHTPQESLSLLVDHITSLTGAPERSILKLLG